MRQGKECLNLNLWTPAADSARRAVMVWIHGGAFTYYSADELTSEGETFAMRDVVLVSIEYRQSALGFMCLDEFFDDASGTGNLGC